MTILIKISLLLTRMGKQIKIEKGRLEAFWYVAFFLSLVFIIGLSILYNMFGFLPIMISLGAGMLFCIILAMEYTMKITDPQEQLKLKINFFMMMATLFGAFLLYYFGFLMTVK